MAEDTKETEEKEESWWDKFISGAGSLGSTAADIIGAFGDDDDANNAYLQGQIDAIKNQQNRDDTSGIIKVGDVEISTSSILWIVGGTIGLLLIGVAVKKLI